MKTIRRIDALLDNYTIGSLIIESKAVSLLLEDNTEIQLDDSYAIEVFDDSQYHLITFDQALNTYCSDAPDWHLFTGIEVKVKRNEVAQMKTIQLNEKELATLKAVLWGQLQKINRDIRMADEAGKDTTFLLEMKREIEDVFEALNFAN
jgi:hypothetical protein